MRAILAVLLGGGLAINGLWMLIAPESWYPIVPGVTHTGPLNVHFVRDIGCAYALAGLALMALAIVPALARGAAWLGCAFLVLHAGVHLADALGGRSDLAHLLGDLPLVFAVPALAVWLTATLPDTASLAPRLLPRLAAPRLRAFERAFDYDAGYLRELLRTQPAALGDYLALTTMARRADGLPRDAWYAAKLLATMAEDCGPCAQLVIDMALKDGVPAATLAALVAGDDQRLPEAVALAADFARAVLARNAEAEPLRDAIRALWGERALASLALAMAASRSFPFLKYALGHGHACVRLRVAQRYLDPLLPAGGAA